MKNAAMEENGVEAGLESIMEKFQSGFTPVIDEEENDTIIDNKKAELEEIDEPDNEEEIIDEEQDAQDEASDMESEYASDMFDVLSEKYGWDVSDDKPSSVEGLLEYIDNYISESKKPSYANETIEELDEFVRNGGNISEYFSVGGGVDYNNINVESESNQRRVLTDLFKRQGFSDKQIERKLDKYEMADILQDEAEDALETLKELVEQEKSQLLEEQKKQKIEYEKNQRKFYEDVQTTVDSLKDIRGIKIPEKEKKELLDYIFKPTKSGRTRYQEEYASSITNLVESAYFVKNKKQLIDSAKKEGEKTAVERFKQKLKNGNVSTSRKPVNAGGPVKFLDLL